MFTLDIIDVNDYDYYEDGHFDYSVYLTYKSTKEFFTLEPENPSKPVLNSSSPDPITFISGYFVQDDITFSWFNNMVEYMDEAAGVTIRINLNQAELESLHYCLRKWQALQHHTNSGKYVRDFTYE